MCARSNHVQVKNCYRQLAELTALKREKRGKGRALMVLHTTTKILYAKKAPTVS